ncbi:ParB/RepB/Spo0J family partition protein [Helicobacter burdigaliensis]|uniref:ParB/RepB/Spo0J family partition protein n=1 Tax=Helicobacter burdigaliensis TaxID=2315334 RepID=UPI000EF6AF86|nr:ParB/RepB/Spo0J family partition protein [Helicobacter burdigaliensis]
MAKKNMGLGRGLSAILGEVEEAYQNDLRDNSGLVVELDIKDIFPNPMQPRRIFDEASLQELAASIEEHGLLQPIIVYEGNEEGKYFLIAGERRLRASKIAKKDSIKAIVVDIKEEKLRELALIENIQREDLNPIDLAYSYKELINSYGITHEELAKRLFKSRAQITNTLRLLELSEVVQQYIVDNKITQGHAKILVTLPKEEQELIANSIIGQKLSVHESEKLIKSYKNKEKHNVPKVTLEISKDKQVKIKQLCELLKEQKVKANFTKNRFIVEFSNDKEVDNFVELLSNSRI